MLLEDHPTPMLTDDDDSSEEREPVKVSKDENDDASDEFEELSLTNKLGIVSLFLIGIAMTM